MQSTTFIDVTKYNHGINESKYIVISNGWLKKGKIPVNYSQPIHRKYVYKINQHSINQHSRIVIEDYFLIRN